MRTVSNAPTHIPEPLPVADGWRLRPTYSRTAVVIWLGVGTLVAYAVWLILLVKLGDRHGFEGWAALAVCLLISLGLTAVFVRSVLIARYAPVIGLTLAVPQLVRGRPATLRWAVTARHERLKDLHLSLVLLEECTYRRGTKTDIDTAEVCVLPLADHVAAHDAPPAADGCTVLVPDDLPPSFAAVSHRLVWMITLRGTARGCPALNETYPVRVVPDGEPAASITATPLPVGTRLPADGPLLLLADDRCPPPGQPLAGVVRAPGQEVTLRLRWETAGKGTRDSGEAASAQLFSGSGTDGTGFVVTLPAMPPAFHGSVLAIVWLVEAVVDGRVIATQRFTAAT